MSFLLFYIVYPDEESARRISDQLVQKRLAACANLFPISSVFWWEGVVQPAGEWVSVIKTRLALEKRLEAEVVEMHPYAVPCILRFEVRANAAYEDWVEASSSASPGQKV